MAGIAERGHPLAQFFFGESGSNGSSRAKVVGFAGILVIIFLAAYSLGVRMIGPS